ncbi:MAG TPA: ATP-binding protein [Streptosporangiaceae bacterium]|nr:ATP-binding protein [Streptosporangiaceae bacterium]
MPPAEATRASDPSADAVLLPGWLVLGSLTLPGGPEHVRPARQFVAGKVGDDPDIDAVLLLTSELVTNAVLHSKSALPGGTFEVVVARNLISLLVLVSDDGSESGDPVVRGDPGAESGNGLLLVQTLSDEWGYWHDGERTAVWFQLRSPGRPDLRLHHRSPELAQRRKPAWRMYAALRSS